MYSLQPGDRVQHIGTRAFGVVLTGLSVWGIESYQVEWDNGGVTVEPSSALWRVG